MFKYWLYSYIFDIAIRDIFLSALFLLYNTNSKVEIDWIINRKWSVIVVQSKLSLETNLECEYTFIIHMFIKGLKTLRTNNTILCNTELYKKIDWRETFVFYEISFYSINFLRNPNLLLVFLYRINKPPITIERS